MSASKLGVQGRLERAEPDVFDAILRPRFNNENAEVVPMESWKPTGYPSMSPYLICNDAEALIDFVRAAFGGILVRKFDRPDGSLMHAEVKIDDSVLMIGGGATEAQTSSPHIHLYVPDASSVFESAIAAGATIVQELQRKGDDDDLRGGVRDRSGTTWWIASQ